MQTNLPAAKASRIWLVVEDDALIGLYLEISECAIASTNQKASELWRKIHEAHNNTQKEKPHILSPRALKSLESHWRRMAADILQWQSCYEEVAKLLESGSGYNEVDQIKNASKLFHISTGHNFTFPHEVEIVKDDPKWRTKLRWALSNEERKACGANDEEDNSGSGKRSRAEVGDEAPNDGFSSGGLPRPNDVKKSKG
ncbi:uncharacterized protein LOC110735615 [Chenopodium quinoa]|uniref:uncharacterized protein LOC110735615 n=1 Tax=Chenopodium quinoa TaxID=63459 RepID=UPI000B7948C1|nr:uncharacterized protein LOC110735615 [Chenopodium quinoa]